MKITILNNQAPFIRGGAEYLADSLAGKLQGRGHRVEVLRIPFKWYPLEAILDHMLACRLLPKKSRAFAVQLVQVETRIYPGGNDRAENFSEGHTRLYGLSIQPVGSQIAFIAQDEPLPIHIGEGRRPADPLRDRSSMRLGSLDAGIIEQIIRLSIAGDLHSPGDRVREETVQKDSP